MTEPPIRPGWEESVQDIARAFRYPPTPDIASGVRRRLAQRRVSPYRRLVWAAAAVLLVMVALLAVPEARAVLQQILRVGGIQIFLVEPTPTITATPSPSRTPHPTPSLQPPPLVSVLDLPGETTLDDAESQTRFYIPLPADEQPPDRVFLQNLGGPVVTLVWLEDDDPTQVRFSLQILNAEVSGSKFEPNDYVVTRVNEHTAYWFTGNHLLAFYNGGEDLLRIINTSILIWEADGITYRLEINASREEAVRIAESLQ